MSEQQIYSRLPGIIIPEQVCPTTRNNYLDLTGSSLDNPDSFLRQNMALVFPINLKSNPEYINLYINESVDETPWEKQKRIDSDNKIRMTEVVGNSNVYSSYSSSRDRRMIGLKSLIESGNSRLSNKIHESAIYNKETMSAFCKDELTENSGKIFSVLESILSEAVNKEEYKNLFENNLVYFAHGYGEVYLPTLSTSQDKSYLYLIIKPLTKYDFKNPYTCKALSTRHYMPCCDHTQSNIMISNIFPDYNNTGWLLPEYTDTEVTEKILNEAYESYKKIADQDVYDKTFNRKLFIVNGKLESFYSMTRHSSCSSCDASLAKAISDDCSTFDNGKVFVDGNGKPIAGRTAINASLAASLAGEVYTKLITEQLANPLQQEIYDLLKTKNELSYNWVDCVNSVYTYKLIKGEPEENILTKLDNRGRVRTLAYSDSISNRHSTLKNMTSYNNIASYSYEGLYEIEKSATKKTGSRKRINNIKANHCSKCAINCRTNRPEWKEFATISEELISKNACSVNKKLVDNFYSLFKEKYTNNDRLNTAAKFHEAWHNKELIDLTISERINYFEEELARQDNSYLDVEYFRSKYSIDSRAGVNMQGIYGLHDVYGRFTLNSKYSSVLLDYVFDSHSFSTHYPLKSITGLSTYSEKSAIGSGISYYGSGFEYRNTDLFKFFIKYLKKNSINTDKKLFDLFSRIDKKILLEMFPLFPDKSYDSFIEKHLTESLQHFYVACLGFAEPLPFSLQTDGNYEEEVIINTLKNIRTSSLPENIKGLIILSTIQQSDAVFLELGSKEQTRSSDLMLEKVANKVSLPFVYLKSIFNIDNIQSFAAKLTAEFININSIALRREIVASSDLKKYNYELRKASVLALRKTRKGFGSFGRRRGMKIENIKRYLPMTVCTDYLNYNDIAIRYLERKNSLDKDILTEKARQNYVEYLTEKNTYALLSYYLFTFPRFNDTSTVGWGTISDIIDNPRSTQVWKYSTTFTGGDRNKIISELMRGEMIREEKTPDNNDSGNVYIDNQDERGQTLFRIINNRYDSPGHNMALNMVYNQAYIHKYVKEAYGFYNKEGQNPLSLSFAQTSTRRFLEIEKGSWEKGINNSYQLVDFLFENREKYHWQYVNTIDSGCYNPGYVLSTVCKRLREGLTK